MITKNINLWVEGDIATNRILSRLLNELDVGTRAEVRFVDKLDWETLVGKINIFSRVCTPRLSWLPGYMLKRHIDYIYFLDDNFWQLVGEGELAHYYQSPEVISSLDQFVLNATLVIVNSETLHNFLSIRFPTVRCYLLSPPFDVEITRPFIHPVSASMEKGVSVIGYAGGYKQKEFDFISEIVLSLLKRRSDIRFEFIGNIPLGLKTNPAAQWFPGFSDYEQYLIFKASRCWNVGLAPLFSSPFNQSKTDNKFREYGGCGIPGIYSDVIPYSRSVHTGVTGILVENKAECWVEAILNIIDNDELQISIRKNAFEYVDNYYSHQSVASEWINVIETIANFGYNTVVENFRFNYCMEHYNNSVSTEVCSFEMVSSYVIIKMIITGYVRKFFSRNMAKLLFFSFVIITLININLFIIRCLLR